MHSYHGDIHEIGLQDDCEACMEHAKNPTRDLDDVMLRNLIFGAVNRNTYVIRTHTEAVAIANILNIMERFGKLCEVAPQYAVRYLQKNWRIPVELVVEVIVE